jgi:acyl-CoA thioesterase I
MAPALSPASRILFIGDSITDVGRLSDPEGLGNGYVRLIRDLLLVKNPATAPTVLNRGISGHKVTDLRDRWEADVIAHAPDLLSIFIGINDVWHALAGLEGVPVDLYTSTYRAFLERTRSALPACKLVLCEPSVIWPPQDPRAMDALQPYIRAVNDLAMEFHAHALVPLHTAFVNARQLRPDVLWAPDGVHPSSTGHMLIAQTWLNSTSLL